LLEGFFEKKCHHTAIPAKTKARSKANERNLTSKNIVDGDMYALQQISDTA
jgi:hypothetical protein